MLDRPEEGVAEVASDGDVRLEVAEDVLHAVRPPHVGEDGAARAEHSQISDTRLDYHGNKMMLLHNVKQHNVNVT